MPSTFENFAHPDNAAAVTTSDTENLANIGCLYVGTGGNVRVLTAGGQTVTFTGVPTGTFIPVMVTRVYATSTTASNILVLY